MLYIIPFKYILASGMVAYGATPPKRFLYSIIPITIILYDIPFKDILARGMVAYGATPP